MKQLFIFLFLFCLLNTMCGQKPDTSTTAIVQLLRQYCNAKDAKSMYELTGKQFRKQISSEQFASLASQNLFPLGNMSEPMYFSQSKGVSQYKINFPSVTKALFLSLDNEGKIETFRFKDWIDDARKNSKVASSNQLQSKMDKAVDAAVQPYISVAAATGLSIGILKNGQPYYYGYGETTKGSLSIPDKHTRFEIGSITKTFTAVLLASAVLDGKVRLDDPYNQTCSDSLPSLVFEGIPITLKTLSNHTSGLPRLPANLDQFTNPLNPYKTYTSQDLFAFYKQVKLDKKPGTVYEYSNLAVATLGVVLEQLYRLPLDQLLTEKICKPLGMKETRQFLLPGDSAKFASGYNEQGRYNGPWDFKAFAGAGAIRSTAADMIRYAQANLGNAPLPLSKAIALTHEVTFSDGNNKTGLGWHFIKPGKEEILFHNGGTGGYRSYLAIHQQKKFAVVVLSNTAIGTDDIGNELVRWLEMND